MSEGFISKFRITLEMIKFEHTIFALPFALLSTVLASSGWPRSRSLFWILVAMVGARSSAMAFNRIVDCELDAENLRTRLRALPAGQLSRGFALGFTLLASLLFIWAAYQLNILCFQLSFPVLSVLFLYSFSKRFTHYSHLLLGLCLGLAPLGAWIAIRGSVQWTPMILSLIVLFWTAGFDIIYACQDTDFDLRKGLYSIPKRYGIASALKVSSFLHALMLVLLLILCAAEGLGWISLVGISLVAGLLWYEHSLVKPDDLSRVDAAFFTVNGYVSFLLLLTMGADKLVH
jgi:4-hydroxybenzoate polyprenyltransferase